MPEKKKLPQAAGAVQVVFVLQPGAEAGDDLTVKLKALQGAIKRLVRTELGHPFRDSRLADVVDVEYPLEI